MKLKEFRELLQEAAKGTQFEGKKLFLGRFNDKRKDHRRIKFMTVGNIKYSEVYFKVFLELKEKGLNVGFDNTKKHIYGDGSVVEIILKFPL